MPFPKKSYFSLSEVSARWRRKIKDVEYCIENGLLDAHIKVCCVKLSGDFCLLYEPVYADYEKDTPETIKQIDKNNIIYDELCMFKPPTSE